MSHLAVATARSLDAAYRACYDAGKPVEGYLSCTNEDDAPAQTIARAGESVNGMYAPWPIPKMLLLNSRGQAEVAWGYPDEAMQACATVVQLCTQPDQRFS